MGGQVSYDIKLNCPVHQTERFNLICQNVDCKQPLYCMKCYYQNPSHVSQHKKDFITPENFVKEIQKSVQNVFEQCPKQKIMESPKLLQEALDDINQGFDFLCVSLLNNLTQILSGLKHKFYHKLDALIQNHPINTLYQIYNHKNIFESLQKKEINIGTTLQNIKQLLANIPQIDIVTQLQVITQESRQLKTQLKSHCQNHLQKIKEPLNDFLNEIYNELHTKLMVYCPQQTPKFQGIKSLMVFDKEKSGIKQLDFYTGLETQFYNINRSVVTCISNTTPSQKILLTGEKYQIRLFDKSNQKTLRIIRENNSETVTIRRSRNTYQYFIGGFTKNDQLLNAQQQSSISCINIQNGKKLTMASDLVEYIKDLQEISNKLVAFYGARDTQVYLYYPLKHTISYTSESHKSPISTICPLYNTDSFATSGWLDCQIKIWSIFNGKLLQRININEGKISCLSPYNNKFFAVGITNDSKTKKSKECDKIEIWSTQNPKLTKSFKVTNNTITSLKEIPYSDLMVATTSNGHLELWNLGSEKLVRTFKKGIASSQEYDILL